MIRLNVVVEGDTEEIFVNEILAPALGERMVFATAHRITTKRNNQKTWRGGLLKWDHLARDIRLWMKQDTGPDARFTTMIDYYALPHDFPGYADLPTGDSVTRIAMLERAMMTDLANRLPELRVADRFIPYIQRHEFEALLFSAPLEFEAAFPGDRSGIAAITNIRKVFSNPEDIDDGQATAPSKRILKIWPDYDKPVAPMLVAKQIGLPTMRRECPLFGRWVARLEALGAPAH